MHVFSSTFEFPPKSFPRRVRFSQEHSGNFDILRFNFDIAMKIRDNKAAGRKLRVYSSAVRCSSPVYVPPSK